MQKIHLSSPFDAHMHWRQEIGLLNAVAKYSIKQFAGGLLMPNTDPKITSLVNLRDYIREVTKEIGKKEFFPIFTYYLSSELKLEDIKIAWESKKIRAIKYYPKGGTTGSDKGLSGFSEVTKILELMQDLKIPLLIHGETPQVDGEVIDDFEREQVFMETELTDLVREFPGLRIVLEHITTKAAADFVLAHKNVFATVTPHHCFFDRRALFNGMTTKEKGFEFDLAKNGMQPDLMNRPILKHRREVRGIQNALKLQAIHGLKKFGLGTDTAPHKPEKKYCECGACGVFSAPIALELYAMAFDEMGILNHLQVFACDVMPEFYGIKDLLPKKIVVIKEIPQTVAPDYSGIVTPFAGQKIPWSVE